MRSEVKKMLEGASSEELKSYIGPKRVDVTGGATALDATHRCRQGERLKGLGLKGGHAALLQIYISAGCPEIGSPAKAASASSGDTATSGEMTSQAMHSDACSLPARCRPECSRTPQGIHPALGRREAGQRHINVAVDIYAEQVRRKHARMMEQSYKSTISIAAKLELDPEAVDLPEADGAL
jgi:hypothetical protein